MTAIKTLNSSNKQLNIGDVFTPLLWGEFAVERFGIFQKWIQGASVFDPTMGIGNLLESLITYGIKKGYSIQELPTHNLFGNELNTDYFNEAIQKFETKYGLNISLNFSNEDLLSLPSHQYDIILGNPPWQNFVDLPESYKEQIKSYFFKYDLIGNSQSLLLGGSRIDIAALMIQVVIKDFLKANGEAVVFMPLSLLLNDGANRTFRTYSIDEVKYSIEQVYDFNDEDVFGGVATRYGLTHFVRDKNTTFPIRYFRRTTGKWIEHIAKPMFHHTDPLSVMSLDDVSDTEPITPIIIKKESSPRQGVNTCGANEIFFFDSLSYLDDNLVQVSNKTKQNVILPKQFIYPLITTNNFKSEIQKPNKWVLLPYNKNGKPLEYEQVKSFSELNVYLEDHKEILQNRKGTMLNAMLKRGHWWALLGVGEYSFFPFKVVWEAYGKTNFNPVVFEGYWQANQSLQAYVPTRMLASAQRIQQELSDSRVENYLLSLKMEGTMNWAQPGKIKKFIKYEEDTQTLF